MYICNCTNDLYRALTYCRSISLEVFRFHPQGVYINIVVTGNVSILFEYIYNSAVQLGSW